MLSNGNQSTSYNDFTEVPYIPYQIIEVLLTSNLQEVENFWKLLKYPTVNCLDEPNLTFEEKKKMIWEGESEEQNYNVFLKPLLGSSLESAEAQTQIRLYRYNTSPTNQFEATILFEVALLTNEKTSMVRKDGILVERTDLMETTFLNFMNGRDIKVGSGYFTFDRTLSRGCNSQISIGNSKSFYGRALMLGLRFVNSGTGGSCG